MDPQPGFGGTKIADDGGGGDSGKIGNFIGRHAAKISHFDRLGFAGGEIGKCKERIVERQDGEAPLGQGEFEAVEIEIAAAFASFDGEAFAGEIDQNLPHKPGANVEEVGPIGPLGLSLLGKPKKGLVDEFGGREAVIAPDGEAGAGQLAQLGINQRGEFFGGSGIAGAPTAEKHGNRPGVHRLCPRHPLARIHHLSSMRIRPAEVVITKWKFFLSVKSGELCGQRNTRTMEINGQTY